MSGKRCDDDFLKVLAWNCYVANSQARVHAALTRWLKREPHIAALNEAARFHDVVRQVARHRGYRMLSEQPGDRTAKIVPEGGNNVVLVRKDVEVMRWQPRPMDEPWTVVSHARQHQPRRPIDLKVKVGDPYALLLTHWPTGGPRSRANGEAVREIAKFTQEWLDGGRDRVARASIGDHNVSVHELRRLLDTERPLRVSGVRVDSAAGTGLDRLNKNVLSKGGSNHHGIEYVMRSAR